MSSRKKIDPLYPTAGDMSNFKPKRTFPVNFLGYLLVILLVLLLLPRAFLPNFDSGGCGDYDAYSQATDQIFDSTVDVAGSVYFVGQMGSADNINGYNQNFTSMGRDDAFIVKMTPAGNLEKLDFFGSDGSEYFFEVLATDNPGDLILLGRGSDFNQFTIDNFSEQVTRVTNLRSSNDSDYGFVVKYSDGIFDWVTLLEFGYKTSLKVDFNDNVVISRVTAFERSSEVINLNADGTLNWRYALPNFSYKELLVGTGPNYYLTGEFVTETQGDLDFDVGVVSIGNSGSLLWSFTYESDGFDFVTSSVFSEKEEIILGGTFLGQFPIVNSVFNQVTSTPDFAQNRGIFLMRLSITGILLQSIVFGGESGDLYEIGINSDNQILVIGKITNTNGIDPIPYDYIYESDGHDDTFLMTFNSNGSLMWSMYLDVDLDNIFPQNMQISSTNQISIVTAMNHQSVPIDLMISSDQGETKGGVFVFTFDQNGSILTSQAIIGNYYDWILTTVQSEKSLFIVGSTSSTDLQTSDGSTLKGESSNFIARLEVAGDISWLVYFGGDGTTIQQRSCS